MNTIFLAVRSRPGLGIFLFLLLEQYAAAETLEQSAAVQTVEWLRQLNPASSLSVSADKFGSVYTFGRGGGGVSELVLYRIDATGNVVWSRNYGEVGTDWSHGISADDFGHVYISGYHESGPRGNVFTAKYDQNGNLLWNRKLGTNTGDLTGGVAADTLGNVFVAGTTRESIGGPFLGGAFDGFVSKYDDSGNLIWTRQIGSEYGDECFGLAADGLGNVFVTGYTGGNIGGAQIGFLDAFLSKFDSAGNLIWSQQFGTIDVDGGKSVAVDPFGNIYVAGMTGGDLQGNNNGLNDVFLTKFGPDGTLIWSRQQGTVKSDQTDTVSTDEFGNIFVAGYVNDSGFFDAYVNKFNSSGNSVWTYPLGRSITGVSADQSGQLYVVGSDQNGAFIAKITEIPEPSTLLITGFFVVLLVSLRRRV